MHNICIPIYVAIAIIYICNLLYSGLSLYCSYWIYMHREQLYLQTTYRIAPNFIWTSIFVIFVNYTEITKTFCYEKFLTTPLSTGLDTLKSQNND